MTQKHERKKKKKKKEDFKRINKNFNCFLFAPELKKMSNVVRHRQLNSREQAFSTKRLSIIDRGKSWVCKKIFVVVAFISFLSLLNIDYVI